MTRILSAPHAPEDMRMSLIISDVIPIHLSVRPALTDSDREVVEDGELLGPDTHQDEAAAGVNRDNQPSCLARKEQEEASSDGLHRPGREGR